MAYKKSYFYDMLQLSFPPSAPFTYKCNNEQKPIKVQDVLQFVTLHSGGKCLVRFCNGDANLGWLCAGKDERENKKDQIVKITEKIHGI